VHTDDAVRGVACWLPQGGTNVSTWGAIRTGALRLPLKVGAAGFARLARWEQVTDAVHRMHAPGPHWYLYVLGVDPAAQRRGVARRLLEPTLDEADTAGLPCYLETQERRNLPIYERFGFHVVEQAVLDGRLSTWGMRREAA
jgi:GNAT superfamily N-acetyltransferase